MASIRLLLAAVALLFIASTNAQPPNEANPLDLYHVEDFFGDAMFDSKWGYYSTGRVFHNGATHRFSSFITWPQGLRPHFGGWMADKLWHLWDTMGRPKPFYLFEFGAGTGVFAYDILLRANNTHPEFFDALTYTIGERSFTLEQVQRKTLLPFGDKARVVRVDAREGQRVREHIETGHLNGIVVSNELLDVFEPVKLRMFWNAPLNSVDALMAHTGDSRFGRCNPATWQEVRVLHSAELSYIRDTLTHLHTAHTGRQELTHDEQVGIEQQLEHWRVRGEKMVCDAVVAAGAGELLQEILVQLPANSVSPCPVILKLLDKYKREKQGFLDSSVKFGTSAMIKSNADWLSDVAKNVLEYMQTESQKPHIYLARSAYREWRNMVASHGDMTNERKVLKGITTQEILMPLSSERCDQLAPWMERHKFKLLRAAQLAFTLQRTHHCEVLMKPGEEAFMRAMNGLLDSGYILSIDYGGDFEALAIQTVATGAYPFTVLGNYGDAFDPTAEQKCAASLYACPGLVDLSTQADFTEVSEAGEMFGLQTVYYGRQWALETLSSGDPTKVPAHRLLDYEGYQYAHVRDWYATPSQEAWASFKFVLQKKQDKRAGVLPYRAVSFTGYPSFPLNSTQPDACGLFRLQRSASVSYLEKLSIFGRASQDPHEQVFDHQKGGERHLKVHHYLHLASVLVGYWIETHHTSGFVPTLLHADGTSTGDLLYGAACAPLPASYFEELKGAQWMGMLRHIHGAEVFDYTYERVMAVLQNLADPAALTEVYNSVDDEMSAVLCYALEAAHMYCQKPDHKHIQELRALNPYLSVDPSKFKPIAAHTSHLNVYAQYYTLMNQLGAIDLPHTFPALAEQLDTWQQVLSEKTDTHTAHSGAPVQREGVSVSDIEHTHTHTRSHLQIGKPTSTHAHIRRSENCLPSTHITLPPHTRTPDRKHPCLLKCVSN
eukprot:GDKI01030172.1.p1 GENE.GDKI01030172.1~~GDKI01030172.1.p1  ORF type:complete len:946 (+),score=261.27 GDKI01030172.1:86-2923(+)